MPDSPGRDGRAAPEREGGSRTRADDRLAPGDAGRGLSGGPSRQLALWRDGEREAAVNGTGYQRAQERAADAAPDRGPGHQAYDETRTLSREAIARSADLQRRYTAEYASMLRVIGDRGVAKEAARVNLSALLMGQSRIVSPERSWNANQVKDAISRGGEDLALIRRAVSRLREPTSPAIEHLRGARPLDVDHER
jgi:hypothetical protein